MKKNVLLLLAVLSYLTVAIVSCNGSEPVPEPDQNNPEQLDSLEQNQEPADSVDQGEKEPVELQKLTMTFEESDQDRIFERKPKFNLRLENPNDTVVTASITIKLFTDKGVSVKCWRTMSMFLRREPKTPKSPLMRILLRVSIRYIAP